MSIEDIRKEIARRQSFIHDALIGQSPEDLERHCRLMGAQDAFHRFVEESKPYFVGAIHGNNLCSKFFEK